MSSPSVGDILPLWDPEIPGERIDTGRLGIRIRPNSPAAAKLAFIPNGSEWLRGVLEERREIDGTYADTRPVIQDVRDNRRMVAAAALRRDAGPDEWSERARCETICPPSMGIHCPECGEDMRGGEYVRAALQLVDCDARISRGIDSLTV